MIFARYIFPLVGFRLGISDSYSTNFSFSVTAILVSLDKPDSINIFFDILRTFCKTFDILLQIMLYFILFRKKLKI